MSIDDAFTFTFFYDAIKKKPVFLHQNKIREIIYKIFLVQSLHLQFRVQSSKKKKKNIKPFEKHFFCDEKENHFHCYSSLKSWASLL